MRRAVVLFCLWGAMSQTIVDQSQLPTFPYPGICAFPGKSIAYNDFTSSLQGNLTFDNKTGWSVTTYELCDPSTNVQKCNHKYQIEAVRILNEGPQCQTCPYHVDTWWNANSPVSGTGQFNSMFGPCFDGQPSIQTVCLQHPALFPQSFVGVYHFALQMPFSSNVAANSLYMPDSLAAMTIHQFLAQGASAWPYDGTTPIAPTDYGLGKRAVITSLSSIQFIDQTTHAIDQQLTDAFLSPYQTENGVEQWIKWAQFWCSPSCHKDSRSLCFDSPRTLPLTALPQVHAGAGQPVRPVQGRGRLVLPELLFAANGPRRKPTHQVHALPSVFGVV